MVTLLIADAENIRVWPTCPVDDCDQQVRGVTHDQREDIYIAQPCGHVVTDPGSLVWVVRDNEPDCGC